MPGLRNPDERKAKLIGTVGRILTEEGYQGIGVNKIAHLSGVSKPMIYEYYGNLNGLLKAYIQRKDYWLEYFASLEMPAEPTTEELKMLFIKILQDQYRFCYQEKEMQKLVNWQISEYHPLMRAICQEREKAGNRLIEMAEKHFPKSKINLKAVLALLVGGIYFIVLHDSAGAGTIAGVDIQHEKDFDAVCKTIAQMVELAFAAAEG